MELAKASHLAIRAQESMLQAKIREELVILRILTRQAEDLSSAALDAERQVGEVFGRMQNQSFYQRREGAPVDEHNGGEELVFGSRTELDGPELGPWDSLSVAGKGGLE